MTTGAQSHDGQSEKTGIICFTSVEALTTIHTQTWTRLVFLKGIRNAKLVNNSQYV
jgi:hypothetical protein